MPTCKIELITNNILSNQVEIEAGALEKVDHHSLLIDGIMWRVPAELGISFGEIEMERGEAGTFDL